LGGRWEDHSSKEGEGRKKCTMMFARVTCIECFLKKCFFETGTPYVAQAGLEFAILPSAGITSCLV
jgi:hypothetical protein